MPVSAAYAGAVAHAGVLFAEKALRTLIAAGDVTATGRTTLAERAQEPVSAEEVAALIDTTIAVVVFAVADLFRLISAEAAAVAGPLIDGAVTVIVFAVTGLGDEPTLWRAGHLTKFATLSDASSASADQPCVTRIGGHDG